MFELFWNWTTKDAVSFYTFVLAIFTAIVGVTAIVQIRYLRRADENAKAAVDLTRQSLFASQRAWLTVEISLIKGQERIIFGKDGALLPIRIDMKNIGNTPAIKVSWHAWIIFENGKSDAIREQSRRCSQIRQQPFEIGPTIFPQRESPDPETDWSFGAGISWAEIDSFLPRTNKPRVANMVTLIGCVDYTFPADPDTHHQTGFIRYVGGVNRLQIPDIPDETRTVALPIESLIKSNVTLDAGAD